MEGSLVAYKVFTNGSVLQASEINDNLMQQSTAVFSNAAARTAAITSPVEGQLTYLEDTNQYASWDGSAWVSPFGMTLLANVSFSGATTVAADNVFTSAFLNYKIVFNGLHSGSAGAYRMQLRNAGSNLTTSYFYQGSRSIASSLNNVTGNNQADWLVGYSSSGENLFIDVDMYNPATTGLTGTSYKLFAFESPSFLFQQTGGHERINATRDGLRIFAGAGTFTGTLKVYGLKDTI
jgi:hypothetical protein